MSPQPARISKPLATAATAQCEAPIAPQPELSSGSLATTATSQPETPLPPQPAQTSECLATAAIAQPNSNPPQRNPGDVTVLLSATQATFLVVVALLMAALLGALTLWLILAFDPYSRVQRDNRTRATPSLTVPPLRSSGQVILFRAKLQTMHRLPSTRQHLPKPRASVGGYDRSA